jgi:hypothetical protein
MQRSPWDLGPVASALLEALWTPEPYLKNPAWNGVSRLAAAHVSVGTAFFQAAQGKSIGTE